MSASSSSGVAPPRFMRRKRRSFDMLENAIPAHCRGPFPELPGAGVLVDREEDDLRAPLEIFEGHIADLAQDARVLGIVAVIPHHEVMPGWHRVDGRIAPISRIAVLLDDLMRDAVRQGLHVMR